MRASSWSNRLAPAREYERGWVKDDVVRYPVRVGFGDETVVRPIVREGRPKVVANNTKVVPSLTSSVVQDDEGAAGCDGVG